MKRSIWLWVSLGLNVAFVGLWVLARQSGSAEARSAVAAPPDLEPVSQTVAPTKRARLHAPAVQGEWIDALRASAVPERLVAEVAAADFEDGWRTRSIELQRKLKTGAIDGDAMRLFDLQHDGEEEKELRAKLGDEGFRKWNQERLLRDYDLAALNLSGSETEALYELRKGVEQQRHDLAEAALRGEVDEAAYEKQ